MSPENAAGATPRPSRIWAVVIIFLLLVTAVSTVIALIKYEPARAIEIRLSETPRFKGNIQIGGAVANPGIYPFSSDDTLGGVIEAAGGISGKMGADTLVLNVPSGQAAPQKIDINRAEAWLLEALPGIGPTRAKTIIAYREANGLFLHTSDLMKVEGIGQSVYDQIKDLITVSE